MCELAALVEAGLTPYEALRTGTYNVAVYYLGTVDSTGTVVVGKRALAVEQDGKWRFPAFLPSDLKNRDFGVEGGKLRYVGSIAKSVAVAL